MGVREWAKQTGHPVVEIRYDHPQDPAAYDDIDVAAESQSETVLFVHEALERLAQKDPEIAELIKLRYFAGVPNQEAAEMLGMEGQLGTLAPGTVADVTVLAVEHGRWTLSDSLGEEIASSIRLRPDVTVRAGRVSRPDSPLLLRTIGRAA